MVKPNAIKILVVDDEAPICDSLILFLKDYDYQVAAAASGEEALSLLEQTPCDVMIVDIRLPGISGDKLIVEVYRRCPHMRFVIYTGSVNFELTEELTKIGLRPYYIFRKPISDMKKFLEVIKVLGYDKDEYDAST